jgi:hypothetical protein
MFVQFNSRVTDVVQRVLDGEVATADDDLVGKLFGREKVPLHAIGSHSTHHRQGNRHKRQLLQQTRKEEQN